MASKKDYMAAKNYLEKYKNFSNYSYAALLLKGFIHCSLQEYESSKESILVAIEKIKASIKLNIDEKKYLTAYAYNVLNKSNSDAGGGDEPIPVDMNFNLDNVHESHKKNFRFLGVSGDL